jgi:nucleotide-binding universal stress UspA family protein
VTESKVKGQFRRILVGFVGSRGSEKAFQVGRSIADTLDSPLEISAKVLEIEDVPGQQEFSGTLREMPAYDPGQLTVQLGRPSLSTVPGASVLGAITSKRFTGMTGGQFSNSLAAYHALLYGSERALSQIQAQMRCLCQQLSRPDREAGWRPFAGIRAMHGFVKWLVLRPRVRMDKKGTNRLAEIRDGRGGRGSRLDAALLAGELYRQQDGNTLSVWNVRHQRYRFFFDRLCICVTNGKNRLEPELALPDPSRVHRRLHDFLQF